MCYYIQTMSELPKTQNYKQIKIRTVKNQMQEVLQIYNFFHEIMTLVIYLPLENDINVF